MSDTPLTDAEYERLAFSQEEEPDSGIGIKDHVFFGMREFARNLERQLNAANAKLASVTQSAKDSALNFRAANVKNAELNARVKELEALAKAVDGLAYDLTGDEGEDDSLTTIRNYVAGLKKDLEELALRLAGEEIKSHTAKADAYEEAAARIHKLMPAMEGGSLFWPQHDGDGNYIGETYVQEIEVIQSMINEAGLMQQEAAAIRKGREEN